MRSFNVEDNALPSAALKPDDAAFRSASTPDGLEIALVKLS
jgi:hypothetical protein